MLTHLERLEAESIHIMREVVAEREPGDAVLDRQDSSVMLHLAMKAFYPAKPPFPLLRRYDLEIPRDDRVSRRDGRAPRPRPACAHQPRRRRERYRSVHARLGRHRRVEDAGQAGARSLRLRRRVRRRAPTRRVAREGAHRVAALGTAPLGRSASARLWSLYNARKRKGAPARVPDLQLDRPTSGSTSSFTTSRSCRSTSRRNGRGRTRRRADHGRRRTPAAARRSECARCAFARSAAIR